MNEGFMHAAEHAFGHAIEHTLEESIRLLPFLLITSTVLPFFIVVIILLFVLGPVLKFKLAVVVAYFDAA